MFIFSVVDNAKNSIIGLFIASFIIMGCDNAVSPEKNLNTKLFERTETLGDRITLMNDQKRNIFSYNSEYRKDLKTNVADDNKLKISLIMQVRPPAPDLFPEIAASHLYYDQDRGQIYISYLVPNESFGGGFDVMDDNIDCYTDGSSDDCNSGSFITNQMDIGAVNTTSNYFYAAGSANSSHNGIINGIDFSTFNSPAAIFRTPVDNFTAGGSIQYADLASFSATDVKSNNGSIYTVTGNSGGNLYQLNTNLDEIESTQPANTDLRSIAFSERQLYVLNGKAEVLSTSIASETLDLSLLGDAGSGLREQTIAKMSYDNRQGGRLYVPLNDGGFSVLNAKTGSVIDNISQNYYTSITIDDKFIYAAAANNSGIINVLRWSDRNNEELKKIGHIKVDSIQANIIKAVGDYLFVASGKKGVTILKVKNSSE